MDRERWARVQALFHEVADLEAGVRSATLAARCPDDPALIAEVEAMLLVDASAQSLVDRDLQHVARDLLQDPLQLPVDRFGPYRATRLLGEGGMGVVYHAVRDDLDSVAAIKVLRDAALTPSRRERFAREQRTLAQLHHPSIATLYDAGVLANGTPWFAMEFVEGTPITEHCANGHVSLRDRLQLFRAVCEAVQHAHRHLVIHRDLKPSNIFALADGTVKLLDFGIAKPLDPLDAEAAPTRTGLRLMTPAYAAPEQFRGEPGGIHTDVYALGVVLYELLSGDVPFDLAGRTPSEAEALVTTGAPERPSIMADRVPRGAAVSATRSQWADLDVLCLTAMHRDPQRRYATVDALIRDVDHFLAGEPLDARPDSAAYQLRMFVRRHRRSVLTAAVVGIGIVGLSAFYAVRLTEARDAALAEATRTQRVQQFLLALFEGGDEIVGPPESLRVVTLIDRGVQEARSLDAEPAIQAELYETLGSVYRKLGQYDRADTLLRASLAQRRRLRGTDHPDAASSYLALGLLQVERAQFDSAEQHLKSALAISERTLPPTHPQVAKTLDALGTMYEERGNYAEAIATFSQAVTLRSAGGTVTPELAQSLGGVANNHFYLGNYATADSLNRRVLEMNRQLHGDEHPSVANDLINLGAARFEQGQYKEAERLYREALTITKRWFGETHPRTGANLTMLGRALRAQEQFDEAVTTLNAALLVNERAYGPNHPRVASTLNDLAAVALVRERYPEAIASYERVVRIYRDTYQGKHYYIGIGIANLASVYLAQGDNVRAEQGFREAIAMYAQTLPKGHVNEGITRIKLGRALLRQRRFAEAETESRTGYEIVSAQTSPSVSWLRSARLDLVAVYDSLGTPDKGARFRAELADSVPRTTPAAK